MIKLVVLNSKSNLLKTNKPNNPPYVNDAICRPIITMAESLSSKISAIAIKIVAQNKLIHLEEDKDGLPLNRSIKVEEASAFIDELKVDIAADKIPANNKPFNPTGKYSTIKVLNSRSLFISAPSNR